MTAEAASPSRVPWLAIARGTAILLAALMAWGFQEGLSEGLQTGVALGWTAGLAIGYLVLAFVTRWRVGLALTVVAGAAGVLLCYALAALVGVGGSVAMSAEAVQSGRSAVAVLALAGLLHAVLAGASLMALLRATRTVQSSRGPS